ncbi:GNAT family N-acetyltransferase [Sediminibacterium ginsengisoli]|uniref:Acetyltransferase (GNAT) family protein n=1 Tax=Sediminibacterium ginsengisoli TaxID=413434 RepID=A0A1T4MMH2_9BACT|nr:GNAT family N-acetyltransferase [Sediminibacterium ginsengisoli]SJZ68320.1 Acetyltransferase (GNAT) family protein [Sediminibacterium ginsengisoli]
MKKNENPAADGYSISTDPALLNLEMIHHYLSADSYWAQHIPADLLAKAIANSICFGVYLKEDQVGFARIVTDKASFAYLCDVFILPDHRGKGLSLRLMQAVHAHPELQGLRRWMLVTRDAHGLYSQFGWKTVPEELAGNIMQIHDPEIYRRKG